MMVSWLVLIFFISYFTLAFYKMQWLFRKKDEHREYVFESVSRWIKWLSESQTNNENDPNHFLNRLDVYDKYNSKDFYKLMEYNQLDIYFYLWNWDVNKLITDKEKYKCLSWDNPVDQNEVYFNDPEDRRINRICNNICFGKPLDNLESSL